MDHKKKELFKNTFIISIGKFSTQLISFLLLPFYTSYLNASEFGVVDLIITYASLLLPCVTLRIESAGFRFLIEFSDDNNKQDRIISNVFIFAILSTFGFIMLYLVAGSFANIPFYNYLLVYSISSIFSSLLLDISRGLGDNISYSIANLIIGGFTIVFNVVFLSILSFGPVSIFLSSTISNFLGCIFIIFRDRIISRTKFNYFDFNSIKTFLKYSLPLIPNEIIWWIISISDRVIISFILGTYANGLYAVSNKFSNAIISIYYVFQLSWTESMCRYATDKDNHEFVSNTFDEVLKIVYSICVLAIVLIPFAFPLLVNSSFADSYNYIPILIISSFFNIIAQLTSSLYISFKMTGKLLITSIIGCIVNVLLNVLFIKKIGLYAASISTLASFLILSIFRIISLRKVCTLSINIKLLILMIISFVFVVYSYYLNNIILNIICFIVIVLSLLLLNKKLIIKAIKIATKKIA